MAKLKRILIVVVAVVVAALAIVFLLVNLQPVEVDLLLFSATASVSLWMVISFIIGGVLGVLSSLGLLLRNKRQRNQLEKKLVKMEKELDLFRASLTKD